jgi:hypothetical protein
VEGLNYINSNIFDEDLIYMIDYIFTLKFMIDCIFTLKLCLHIRRCHIYLYVGSFSSLLRFFSRILLL